MKKMCKRLTSRGLPSPVGGELIEFYHSSRHSVHLHMSCPHDLDFRKEARHPINDPDNCREVVLEHKQVLPAASPGNM